MQYKAQFLTPDAAVCKAYAQCEQKIIACPWNAVPAEVLHGMKSLGIHIELPHIQTLARAAQ
eukprot:10587935-Heterocapsa_arctica.AAC.1